MIEQSVVEEIKQRCPIDEVISEYVTLKRAGSNLVGLCPFHSEKSPSFTVYQNDGHYHCFGCKAGGDVITFIRQVENLDYPSALEFLAKRAGITLATNRDEKESAARRERTLAMNKEAARYFRHVLLETPEGKPGLDYLFSRGLTMPTIKHFGLGFAPSHSNDLLNLLKSKGYTDAEMTSAFLAKFSEKTNRMYGLFWNRVIFPIIATTGDVIGFGGRVMDDSKPKYLNTQDTPAFKKSKHLFALNFAKKNCGEQLILCEGYMDVIALHAAGFTNAVATLGTAITSDQARIFSRYTKSVLICYDADEAGQKAAATAFRLLGEVGLECKILKVKNAKDPDEYLKKYGAAAFRKLMEGSRSEFDYYYDAILTKYDLSVTEEKFKALDEVISLIARTSSAARREVFILRASKDFEISADSIKHDVERLLKKRTRQANREEHSRMIQQSAGYGDRVNPDFVKNPKAAAAEEVILGILLLHPEFIAEMRNKGVLPSPDDFATGFGRRIYERMLELSEHGDFEESALGEFFTVEEIGRITKLRLARMQLTDNSVELLLACHRTLVDAVRKKELSLEELLQQKRASQKKRKAE